MQWVAAVLSWGITIAILGVIASIARTALDADRAKRNGPEARAQALLRANLTPVQLREFDGNGTIPVVGGVTGTLYLIRRSVSANVQIVKAPPHQFAPEGKKHLCFMPLATLPMSDTMLAQKIALESDELHVLAIAGRF